MIEELRFGKLVDGFRGRPPVSRACVAQLLLRLALLIDDHPEIAEIDLNPVIGRGEELTVVDIKVRGRGGRGPPRPGRPKTGSHRVAAARQEVPSSSHCRPEAQRPDQR
jgi:hypothetical protein